MNSDKSFDQNLYLILIHIVISGCSKVLKGNLKGNLRRHFKNGHQELMNLIENIEPSLGSIAQCSRKVDSASRGGQNILDINCQIIEQEIMLISTLGMIKINLSQTSINLKKKL